MLLPRKLLRCKKIGVQVTAVATYSRKSDSKNDLHYKIVKTSNVSDDSLDTRFGPVLNWELLAPKGYRFVLPGSIGPAWHEPLSMLPVTGFDKATGKPVTTDFDTLECTAQECPILLRKGVQELFPGIDTTNSQQITVVTLTQKPESSFWKSRNLDMDYYAKAFIWAAQEICIKLKMAGYWADFINPFSGRPYLSAYPKANLYETDQRFRCIGFEIRNNGNCKVIQCMKGDEFIGSLFTNAPASPTFLYDILNKCEIEAL